MKMYKKILITSIVIILVPTLIYLPVFLFLNYSAAANDHDYSGDVQGRWDAIQYYYEKDRIVCKDDVWMSLTVNGDRLAVDGTVLPPFETSCSWESGSSIGFELNGENYLYILSFDENNHLKLIIDGTPYVFILRRSEG